MRRWSIHHLASRRMESGIETTAASMVIRERWPRNRGFEYAEIRNTVTGGRLNVVIDLSRKDELRFRVKTSTALECRGYPTGYLSSGKKGRTALMLRFKIP